MIGHTSKCEYVEIELIDVAAELTALGDMIPCLFDYEDMESRTPNGIKLLITDIRKRIEALQRYVGDNFRSVESS